MSFKKTFCTCLGCLAGAACIILSGGTATPLVVATAIGVGGVAGHLVGHKLEQEEKETKNEERQTQNQQKIIDTITKDNETKQAKTDKIAKEHKKQEEENTDLEKQAKEERRKSNDSSLSEEERRKHRTKAIELEERLEKGKDKSRKMLDQINQLQNQISNNNKTISSVGSGSYDKKQGIWEFLTLENILIAFAIYALWQIIREDSRR